MIIIPVGTGTIPISARHLSPSEALYGFGAWLTSRADPVTMSAKHNAAIVAELIDEFCKRNELGEPRNNWTDNLIHPD